MLARADALLGAFDHDQPVLSLTELARRAGLPKSSAHRILTELCELRILERQEDGQFRLGLRLFEIGQLAPQHRTLSEAALPIMSDLQQATRARIHLAVLDGIDVVYLEIIGGADLGLASRTGGRLPAHATGVGKVLLAYSPASLVKARIEAGLPRLTPRTIITPGGLVAELRKIRTNGMSLDLEESALGISCVAAPVFGAQRTVSAALSITGRTTTFDPGLLGPAARTAAFTLSRLLKASGI